jgi:hypothetical protein
MLKSSKIQWKGPQVLLSAVRQVDFMLSFGLRAGATDAIFAVLLIAQKWSGGRRRREFQGEALCLYICARHVVCGKVTGNHPVPRLGSPTCVVKCLLARGKP